MFVPKGSGGLTQAAVGTGGMCQDRVRVCTGPVTLCTQIRGTQRARVQSLPQSNGRRGLTHTHEATVTLRKPLTQQMGLGPVSLLQESPELSPLFPGCPGRLQEGL